SLVRDELRRLRGDTGEAVDAAIWDASTTLGGEAVGADSIERLTLATAVAERFGLHELDAGDYLLRKHTLGEWADIAAQGVQRAGAITFRTSGTTGEPKPHRHTLADLEQEVAHLAALFPGTRRVVSLAPAHHIYGFLFGVLLPREMGCPVHHDQAGGGLPPSDLDRGDLVVGFPLRWRQLATLYPAFPVGVTGVTSTAPCPPALARDLAERGLERFVAIYGATETAGIGYRDDPEEPFRLFEHWESDGLYLYRRRRDGIGKAITPPDHLEFHGTRHFVPAGRRDGAVQVAGVNVHPDGVAEQLRARPGVAEAAVHLDQQAEPRLAAWIVPEPETDPEALEAELREWVRTSLTPPERPVRLTLAEDIPRGPLGKPAVGKPA
ncbi:MAG: AMP-binding protein, partial [Pseudomonadota bacterium]